MRRSLARLRVSRAITSYGAPTPRRLHAGESARSDIALNCCAVKWLQVHVDLQVDSSQLRAQSRHAQLLDSTSV